MRRDELLRGARELGRQAATSASYRLDRPLVRPRDLIFLMTHRCNLRCAMCQPKDEVVVGKGRELTLDRWRAIVDQAPAFGARSLTFSGGEPLLRHDDTLDLVSRAHRLGLGTTVITNGTRWGDGSLDAFVAAGLDAITVSIDGADAGHHDGVRGVPGSFDRAMALLREARGRLSTNAVSVVMHRNLDQLIPLYEQLLGLDITSYMVQVVSDEYPELMPGRAERPALRRVIDELIALRRRDGVIHNDEDYLRAMPDYFAYHRGEGDAFPKVPCLAGYESLIVTPDGGVDICGHGPHGISLADTSLEAFWTSPAYREARRRVRHCDRRCMFLCYPALDWRSGVRGAWSWLRDAGGAR